jgi:lactate dehydrogenase-like 2-hydroxyacid dehydrogenase
VAEGLISKERIDAMREGTYFINTSDANAVDQASLTQRMVANEVYAALDVYQGLPTTHTLGLDDNHHGKVGQLLSNHVLTYRAGWKTQESIRVKTYKLLGHMMDALHQE